MAYRRDKPDSRPQTPPEAIFSPQVVRRHSAWRRCSFAIWALILDNRNQPDDDWLFCYRDFPIHFQCKLRETLSLREKALPNGVAIYLKRPLKTTNSKATSTIIAPIHGVCAKPYRSTVCPPTMDPRAMPTLKAAIFRPEATSTAPGVYCSAFAPHTPANPARCRRRRCPSPALSPARHSERWRSAGRPAAAPPARRR